MTLHIGIKFKTSARISDIESLLEENCQGEWDLDIESLSTALCQKYVAIYFEVENDRDAFKSTYANSSALSS